MKSSRDVQINYWSYKNYDELNFSETTYRRFCFDRHFHNYYTAILIREGVNEGFTDAESYRIGPDSIIIINPGELHAGHSFQSKFLRFTSVSFNYDFISRLSCMINLKLEADIRFQTKPIRDTRLVGLISQIFSHRSFMSPLELDQNILDFFVLLTRRYSASASKWSTKMPKREYILRAIDYIKGNYANALTLAEIARHAGVSQYHLVRMFQKYTGQTPFKFLKNHRIEQSKYLLKENRPLTYIAQECGFYDQSHYIRNFVKNEGVVPSKFVEKYT